MSHFIAFYQCNKCGKTICGLILNTMLTLWGESKCGIFNPHRDEIKKEIKVFCPECGPTGNFGQISTSCQICQAPIRIFYQPEFIMAIEAEHLGGSEMIVNAKNLLVQYEHIAFYSVDCLRTKYPHETIEPTFLKFKVKGR